METPDRIMPQHTPDSRTDAATARRTSTDDPPPPREERRHFSRRIDCDAERARDAYAASAHAPHGRGVPRR